MNLKVAVVGAGPSGCYAAEHLLKQRCEIDVIDALPTPFGLVRYGVAPDHRSTKAVTRILSRTLGHPALRYHGNLRLGGDLSLDELRELYDAVILATGASADRRLDIPGEQLPGVYGSRAFVDWYNLHPGRLGEDLELREVREVLIIGNGNVALDIARLLAKTEDELAGSDLGEIETAALGRAAIRRIHIVGRRGAQHVRFSLAELTELTQLARLRVEIDAPDGLGAREDYADGRVHDLLASLPATARADDGGPPVLCFHFGLRPLSIEGQQRAQRVRMADAAGRERLLDAQLVVSSIGYRCADSFGLARDGERFANSDGRIAAGLYAVGWAKRGPSGVIGSNRSDSHMVAKRAVEECSALPARPGRGGLERLIAARGLDSTDFDSWQRIDEHERVGAPPQRVRSKLRSLAEMLDHARRPPRAPDQDIHHA